MMSRASVLKERLNCITSQHMLTALIGEDTARAMHFPQYATGHIAWGKNLDHLRVIDYYTQT